MIKINDYEWQYGTTYKFFGEEDQEFEILVEFADGVAGKEFLVHDNLGMDEMGIMAAIERYKEAQAANYF